MGIVRNQIRKNEMSGACSTCGGEERCIQDFGGVPEGKRPLRRPWRRWEHTVQIGRQELGWGHGPDLSGSGSGQVACSLECGNEPSASIKFGELF